MAGLLVGFALVGQASAVIPPLPLIALAADIEPEALTILPLHDWTYERCVLFDNLEFRNVPLPRAAEVDLDLCRFDVFAPNAQLVAATPAGEFVLQRPPVALFRGKVRGDESSSVFLSFSPDVVQGWILTRDHTYWVSSADPALAEPVTIFSPEDLPQASRAQPPLPFCGVTEKHRRHLAEIQDQILAGRSAGARETPPPRCLTLAIETDQEYTANLFGGDTGAANAYLATLIGAVSERYNEEINVEISIGYSRLWTTTDPWSGANTDDQLDQLANYWIDNMGHVSRTAVHMLSGRALGGGIAYLGTLCSEDSGYAVSADLAGSFPYPLVDFDPNNWDFIVVAHELGHNCGANHTHCASPPIDTCWNSEPGCWSGTQTCTQGTLMSYCHQCPGGVSNIDLQFHARTKSEEILPYLDVALVSLCTLCYDGTWVDYDYSGTEFGWFWAPYNTFEEGLAEVPTGGNLIIKYGGSTPWTGTLSEPLTINNWSGSATIGQ